MGPLWGQESNIVADDEEANDGLTQGCSRAPWKVSVASGLEQRDPRSR